MLTDQNGAAECKATATVGLSVISEEVADTALAAPERLGRGGMVQKMMGTVTNTGGVPLNDKSLSVHALMSSSSAPNMMVPAIAASSATFVRADSSGSDGVGGVEGDGGGGGAVAVSYRDVIDALLKKTREAKKGVESKAQRRVACPFKTLPVTDMALDPWLARQGLPP